MTTFRSFLLALTAALFAATGATAAPAIPDTYTVGSGANCDYFSLQQAIDDARNNGLAMTTLQLARDFYGLALEIHGQSLTIIGGYDSCGGRQGLDRTLLDGETSGIGDKAPVIRFSDGGTGPESIILRQVRIQGGDPLPGEGGGGPLGLNQGRQQKEPKQT